MQSCLLNSSVEKAADFTYVSYTQDHTDGLPEDSVGELSSLGPQGYFA